MKSRTSCCNGAVLKRTIMKGLPLWGAYLLIWLVIMPLVFYSNDRWNTALELRDHILTMAAHASQLFGAGYGLASACLVFSFLYKSRSANFFGALPLARNQLFANQYLAGLLFAVVPNLIVVLLSLPICLIWGAWLLKDLAIWFVVMTLVYLFYYSFAAMLAMVVGNLPALAGLYAVLNFTAVVVEAVVRELLDYFIYGLHFDGNFALSWASPLFYTVIEGNGCDVKNVWDEVLLKTTDYYFVGWKLVLIMGALGAAFAVIALLLHKYRRMEAAGDVIAVNHLKPVFLYCFTVGCSLVLGYALAQVLVSRMSIGTRDFIPVLLCMLAGAFIGYFAGQMMLHKTLRVFRKRHWLNWAITCVAISAVMLCARFDVLGIAHYVPEQEDVLSVTVSYREAASEDPELIAEVRDFHRQCIDRRVETERARDCEYYHRAYISYELKDGRMVCREYQIPVGKAYSKDPNSLSSLYEGILNDPGYKLLRCLPPHYTASQIQHCEIYNNATQVYLTPDEAYTFLKTCLEPDLRETFMENTILYEEPTIEYIEKGEMVAEAVPVTRCNLNIQLDFAPDVLEYGSRSQYYHIDVTMDAFRTLAFAEAHGIVPDVSEGKY